MCKYVCMCLYVYIYIYIYIYIYRLYEWSSRVHAGPGRILFMSDICSIICISVSMNTQMLSGGPM